MSIDPDIWLPTIDDLCHQGVNFLRLQLNVVAVHVEAFFVGAPAHFSPIRVDRRNYEHHDFVKQWTKRTLYEVANNFHRCVFTCDLATVNIVDNQHHWFLGLRQIRRPENRGVRKCREHNVAPHERFSELDDIHQVSLRLEFIDKLH